DRSGLRIVYEIKRDAVANVVLNKLYQLTALQTSFSVNNIALVKGRPMTLNLLDLIVHFVNHRHDVIVRRTKFELQEAEKRAHILEGLLIALDHLDEVIALIRGSQTPNEARIGLMERFNLSEIQARAILDMRLQTLTGLQREKLRDEYNELLKLIDYLKLILSDESVRMGIIKQETNEIKEKYGDDRKTRIIYSARDFKIEDTIADEGVVITISHMGYIKRTPLTEYRKQSRGGRGMKGSDVREEDFLENLYIATMHNYLLIFTEKGKCFWMRVYEIPEGGKNSKGRAIQNLLNIESDDKIRAVINVKDLKDPDYIKSNFIILCTCKGTIKKTSLEAYSRPRQNGINAINIREDDHLLDVRMTNDSSEIIMALKSGRAIRFNEKTVRPMGRNATGVRGVTLADQNDEVVGMICLENDQYEVLVVSENGYGKRSALEDYRITNRGGKGVKTMNITEKTGNLIAIKNVTDNDDLMIINKSGVLIRLGVAELRIVGRATQGVKLINIREGDAIAAVAKVEQEEEILEENIDNDDNDIINENEIDSSEEIVEFDEDSTENESDENFEK
ncbi:MAG: DNA gyrase C-terminal beta-propeller domain-containing protein, partial [Bacteroidota bacterium]|nr:DNA gyrase C-terminal beta-propeller domain-containing protein [Bacteroidota bacterium]